VDDFEKMYLQDLYKREYPPSGHVYLRGNHFVWFSGMKGIDGRVSDMNKEETKCHELTETIAAVLDNNHLQKMFVSMQKNNMEISMKYALEE
jgi:hypothetical protein